MTKKVERDVEVVQTKLIIIHCIGGRESEVRKNPWLYAESIDEIEELDWEIIQVEKFNG